jgi:hypothetical protein
VQCWVVAKPSLTRMRRGAHPNTVWPPPSGSRPALDIQVDQLLGATRAVSAPRGHRHPWASPTPAGGQPWACTRSPAAVRRPSHLGGMHGGPHGVSPHFPWSSPPPMRYLQVAILMMRSGFGVINTCGYILQLRRWPSLPALAGCGLAREVAAAEAMPISWGAYARRPSHPPAPRLGPSAAGGRSKAVFEGSESLIDC